MKLAYIPQCWSLTSNNHPWVQGGSNWCKQMNISNNVPQFIFINIPPQCMAEQTSWKAPIYWTHHSFIVCNCTETFHCLWVGWLNLILHNTDLSHLAPSSIWGARLGIRCNVCKVFWLKGSTRLLDLISHYHNGTDAVPTLEHRFWVKTYEGSRATNNEPNTLTQS